MTPTATGRPRPVRRKGRPLASLALVVLSALLPPAAFAHAGGAPFIVVPLDHVDPGTPFPIIGADLGPSAKVGLAMSLAGQTASLGTVTAGTDGHFEATGTLPPGFPNGYASLTATAEDGTSAQAYVLVGARTESTPAPPAPEQPPFWADPSILIFGALILAALGGLVVLWTRPRARRE